MNKRAANLAHKKLMAEFDEKIAAAQEVLNSFQADYASNYEPWDLPLSEEKADAWNDAHDNLSALEGQKINEDIFHHQRWSGVSSETARLVSMNID